MSDTLSIPITIAEQAAVFAGTVSELKLIIALEGSRQSAAAESLASLKKIGELTGMKVTTIRRANEALEAMRFAYRGIEAHVLQAWSPITRPDWAINRFVHVRFSDDWIALASQAREVVELPISDLRALTTKAGLLLTLRFLAAFRGSRQRARLEMRKNDMPLYVGALGVAARMAAAVRVHVEPACDEINRASSSMTIAHRVITRGGREGAHVFAVEFNANRLHRRPSVEPPIKLVRPLGRATLPA